MLDNWSQAGPATYLRVWYPSVTVENAGFSFPWRYHLLSISWLVVEPCVYLSISEPWDEGSDEDSPSGAECSTVPLCLLIVQLWVHDSCHLLWKEASAMGTEWSLGKAACHCVICHIPLAVFQVLSSFQQFFMTPNITIILVSTSCL